MAEILSVTQLTLAIKGQLESRFSYVAVRGEVSNLRHQSSGHLYFTLKDKEAQISAALFRGVAGSISRLPKDGDEVLIRGQLSVYPPRGNYQLIVREVQFSGVGELLQRLHALKLELDQKGWFDKARKKPLPAFPKTIGVVTSPTGSVIQDILNILSRRFSGFQLLLNPVRVQGPEAAQEIARAIDDFNRYKLADVLIVGRGGGSLEDLWPFNERVVAEAVFRSEIPIISAVGHETDFSICDFVADLRAPTPSAAAEMVSIEQKEVLLQLDTLHTRLAQTATAAIRTQKGRLSGLTRQPAFASPALLLAPFAQKIDEVKAHLDGQTMRGLSQIKMRLFALIKAHERSRPGSRIPSMQRAFEKWGRDLHQVAKQQLTKRRERLEKLSAHLSAIDPRNLLKKGYAIAFSEKGDSVILSKDDVALGQMLQLQLQDGKLFVNVEKIAP